MFGGPAITNLVYGGYEGEEYEGAESILITIPLNNHVTNNTLALAWEKEFLNFMKVCRTSYKAYNYFLALVLYYSICLFDCGYFKSIQMLIVRYLTEC